MTIQFIPYQRRIRSHDKSRNGCLECKTRRVKCCEARPICDNCSCRRSACTYAEPREQRQVQQKSLPQLTPPLSEHALNLTDLRLLHHFLIYARPHLPLGREETWVTNIPCRASEQAHLMHAILALSATHLENYDNSISPSVSLYHRQKALSWLSDALSSRQDVDVTNLEVLTDVSVALMFQAGYMHHTFHEFMAILRGIGALDVAKCREPNYLRTTAQITTHSEANNRFQHIKLDERILQAAAQSLLSIEHLFLTDGPVREVYEMEREVAKRLQKDSWEGYMALWNLHTTIIFQTPETAAMILDANDPFARVLQAHTLSLAVNVTPLRLYEIGERAKWHPVIAMVTWIEDICGSLSNEFSPFVVWPLQVSLVVKIHAKEDRMTAADLAALVLDCPELFLMPR